MNKMVYWLDMIDSEIQSLLDKKYISKQEALDLQNMTYAYENLQYGYEMLLKKIDYLLKNEPS